MITVFELVATEAQAAKHTTILLLPYIAYNSTIQTLFVLVDCSDEIIHQ